ncbi:MAG: class F sortase [Anaerolineae bacterium]|nr:class F sortase [Anaerolineae bacterium]
MRRGLRIGTGLLLSVGLLLNAALAHAHESPQLVIPDLRLVVPLGAFPLGAETWEIDPWDTGIGHLEGTAGVTDPGNAVLAGHAEMPDGAAGPFARIVTLRPGAHIIVRLADGEQRYVVVKISRVHPDDLTPVYPALDARLTLITCDVPTYDPATGEYERRVIVVARRVGG